MLECFFILLPYIVGIWAIFAVVYPLTMIAAYKLTGKKLTVREILKKI